MSEVPRRFDDVVAQAGRKFDDIVPLAPPPRKFDDVVQSAQTLQIPEPVSLPAFQPETAVAASTGVPVTIPDAEQIPTEFVPPPAVPEARAFGTREVPGKPVSRDRAIDRFSQKVIEWVEGDILKDMAPTVPGAKGFAGAGGPVQAQARKIIRTAAAAPYSFTVGFVNDLIKDPSGTVLGIQEVAAKALKNFAIIQNPAGTQEEREKVYEDLARDPTQFAFAALIAHGVTKPASAKSIARRAAKKALKEAPAKVTEAPQPAATPEVANTLRAPAKGISIAQQEAAKAQSRKIKGLTIVDPKDLPQMPALQTVMGINAARDYPSLFADVRVGIRGKSHVGAKKILDYDRGKPQNYDQIDVNAIPAEYWERYGGEGIVKRSAGELGEADFQVFVDNARSELRAYAETGKQPDPYSVPSLETYGTAEPPTLESLLELRAFTGVPDPKLLTKTFKDISNATTEMIKERRIPEAMRPGVDQALEAMIEHDRGIRGAEATGNWLTQTVEKVVPSAERQQLMVHAYEHKMKGRYWGQLNGLEKALTQWLASEKRKLNEFVDKNNVLERMEEKNVNHIFHHWINPESGQPYAAMYGKFSKGLPQAKQRTIPTYEAGISQGLQPATTNLGKLIGMEWQSAMQSHQTRQMFASLNSIEVLGPEAGTILLRKGGKPRPLRYVERWNMLRKQGLTEGYERYTDPKSVLDKPITYKDAKGNLRIVKGPVGIRKELYSYVRAYIEDPSYGKFDQLNNAAKSLKLASMFHVVSLAAQEAANFRIPFKNIPRGLKLAESWDNPTMRRLYENGLELNKGFEDVGYQTSFFTGNTNLTKFGNQITKPIQYMRDFIFNVVQPGMKASFTYDTFNKGLSRYLEAGKKRGMTEEQSTNWAARTAVQAGDGHFSGEHWKRSLLETNQFMVKLYFLPESRIWWQRALLSPTWQREHLLVAKRVAQSFMPESMNKKLGLEDLGPIRREYRKYALGAATMIGMVDLWNQMSTYQMDGESKHIWENPEGKGFAVRAWWDEPDYTVVDENGVERTIKGGAAYIRPLKSVFEVAEFATDPVKKFGYKLSPLLTATARQLFPSKYQQEYKGLPDIPKRVKDFLLDAGTPMAAERGAKVLRGEKELPSGILPFFGFPTSVVKNKSKRAILNTINKLILEGNYEEAESVMETWNRKNIEDMIQ